MKHIHLEVDGPVATLVLDRPPVNAISAAMAGELIAARAQIDRDDLIRVAIITGAGRCFSAGVDLKEQLAALEAGDTEVTNFGPRFYDALLNGRKPLIAALNGHALGAGVGIAASCNILVAAEGVEIGLPEINVGVLGGARHAMRLLGHSTVNRMLLTGHRIGAAELARRGAIEACVPGEQLLAYAKGIAQEIAAKDPEAITLACQCLSSIETLGVLDGYVFESRLSQQLGATEAARNLMRGFLERKR